MKIALRTRIEIGIIVGRPRKGRYQNNWSTSYIEWVAIIHYCDYGQHKGLLEEKEIHCECDCECQGISV